jgi:flagellar biosynthesis protein FliP
MAISATQKANVLSDLKLTDIQILSDYVDEYDEAAGVQPVPTGTLVPAYITSELDYIIEPGEAWYVRPDTGDDWLSLPGDYQVV